MSNLLYIPKKIKVGFVERNDTYTGKLAYIIYYDEKGVLRKQTSWESWRDKRIEALELDNEPRNGFIFNKGVQRDGYWGSGRSVIRVYDDRGFEFEIDVDNLIGILMHSDVSKRDIQEECVFAWSGKNLVLLPVNSEAYKDAVKHTEKQTQNISTKSLVPGYTYNQKKGETLLTYIGYFDWFEIEHYYHFISKHIGKKHIFFDGNKFIYLNNIKTLASVINEEVHVDYAKYVDDFSKTLNANELKDLDIELKGLDIDKKIDGNTIKYYKKIDNLFIIVQHYQDYQDYQYYQHKEYDLQSLSFLRFKVIKQDKSLISEYEPSDNNFQNLEGISQIKEDFKNKLIAKGVKIDATSQYSYWGSSHLKSSRFSKEILKEVLEELEFGKLIGVDISDRKIAI